MQVTLVAFCVRAHSPFADSHPGPRRCLPTHFHHDPVPLILELVFYVPPIGGEGVLCFYEGEIVPESQTLRCTVQTTEDMYDSFLAILCGRPTLVVAELMSASVLY